MKTAKIEKIMEVKERTGDYGTTYYISLKMDNGDMITLGKKSKDAFKEGDTVSYESYNKDGKVKYKEVKENNFTKKSFNPEATNKSATIGMAIKTAFELLYDKEEQNFKECIALAHRIYEEAMAMYNGTKEEEKSDEAELPF